MSKLDIPTCLLPPDPMSKLSDTCYAKAPGKVCDHTASSSECARVCMRERAQVCWQLRVTG